MLESKLLLDSGEIFKLWSSFGEAIGLDKLRAFYSDYWPRRPLEGEIVWKWVFSCPELMEDNLVGWSSVRADVLDPIVWMNVGIFPKYQYIGNSKTIIRATVEQGFNTFPDCSWLFVAVSKANVDHLQTRMRYQAKHPTKWVMAGEMNVPKPGYVIFGIERNRFFEPRKLDDDAFPEGKIDYPPEREERSLYDLASDKGSV